MDTLLPVTAVLRGINAARAQLAGPGITACGVTQASGDMLARCHYVRYKYC